MDVFAGVGVVTINAEDVRADDGAARLPHRFERFVDFKLIWPSPSAFAGERKRVFDQLQIGDVE